MYTVLGVLTMRANKMKKIVQGPRLKNRRHAITQRIKVIGKVGVKGTLNIQPTIRNNTSMGDLPSGAFPETLIVQLG